MGTVLVIVVALLGVLARTFVPYLQLLKEKPDTPFDRKFVVPAIASGLISILTLPLILGGLPDTAWLANTAQGYVLVFIASWGLTDIARSGQKQVGF